MRFIYSNAERVIELFKELNINFEYRSFGIIPSSKKRGGYIILEKLQQYIQSVKTETELIDFLKTDRFFRIILRKRDKDFQLKSRYLVLATGGYAGKFEITDNTCYNKCNIFEIVKKNNGEIINLDCILTHPFGYDTGKKILIGNDSKKGEFIDSEGNPVFDKKLRQLIKNDDYHESFNLLLKQIEDCRKKGFKVYFIDANKKIEITPTVHYTAGGIKANYEGEVIGCKNLFVIGECRADGSKNGGRLPGYSFTSSIVNAKYLAERISGG